VTAGHDKTNKTFDPKGWENTGVIWTHPELVEGELVEGSEIKSRHKRDQITQERKGLC